MRGGVVYGVWGGFVWVISQRVWGMGMGGEGSFDRVWGIEVTGYGSDWVWGMERRGGVM